jgi:hypothetical protein
LAIVNADKGAIDD